jgi:hypothetical protein
MTDQEREELLQFMEEFRQNLTQESARKFLIDLGIYNENGKLTENYQNFYIPDQDEVLSVQ